MPVGTMLWALLSRCVSNRGRRRSAPLDLVNKLGRDLLLLALHWQARCYA